MYALVGYKTNNCRLPKVTLWGLYTSLEETKIRIRNLIKNVNPNSRGIYYGDVYTLWIKQIDLGDLHEWDLSPMVSF